MTIKWKHWEWHFQTIMFVWPCIFWIVSLYNSRRKNILADVSKIQTQKHLIKLFIRENISFKKIILVYLRDPSWVFSLNRMPFALIITSILGRHPSFLKFWSNMAVLKLWISYPQSTPLFRDNGSNFKLNLLKLYSHCCETSLYLILV